MFALTVGIQQHENIELSILVQTLMDGQKRLN